MTYTEIEVNLDQFMANAFAELLLYDSGYVCFNYGLETQDILLHVDLAMRFQTCYKVIL